LTSDFKYLANNFEADGEDIVTAPLHLEAAGAMLTNRRFYLVVAGAGAVFGGSFALDQTMRSHLRSMGSSTADLLQNVSMGVSARPPPCSTVMGFTAASRARDSARSPPARVLASRRSLTSESRPRSAGSDRPKAPAIPRSFMGDSRSYLVT
jgi:hypothetical protein